MGISTKYLEYDTKNNEKVRFPVAEITGYKPGPHFVITAGIHGCEYPAIAAAIKFIKNADCRKLKGKVTVVTISSLNAFEKRCMFVSPIDGKNPNRFFPGDRNGTYTDVLTYYLLNDIISKADYYIDMHGGDMVEMLEPFAIYHYDGDQPELTEISKRLACAYALPNVIATTTKGAWTDTGTTYANAARLGIPSAIVEAGCIGQLTQDAVELHLRGIENVLRTFGCLDGDIIETEGQRLFSDFVWVYTKHKGICYVKAAIGDCVVEGDSLATVEDYFGEFLEDVTAPVAGRIVFVTTSPAMAEKGLVLAIGVQKS